MKVFIMLRHSDWGMEEYKLSTSTATSIASSGTWRFCRVMESAVELWR